MTDGAEKGLILIRVVMTVIYAHVIHSLRRAATKAQPTHHQLEELATAFNQQFQQLSSELSEVRETFHRRLSSELSPLHESWKLYQEVLASIPAMQAQLQHLESSAGAERHKRPLLHALPPVQQRNHEASRTRPGKKSPRRVKEVHRYRSAKRKKNG